MEDTGMDLSPNRPLACLATAFAWTMANEDAEFVDRLLENMEKVFRILEDKMDANVDAQETLIYTRDLIEDLKKR